MIRTPLAVAVFAIATVAACSSSTTPAASGASPTLSITKPTNGGAVMFTSSSADVNVEFAVTNFTLKDPGSCGATAKCGHVQLFIDGPSCDDASDPKAKKSWNHEASASPTTAGLDYCPGFPAVAGMHTLNAELHNDDESGVLGADGKIVSSQITFMAMAGADTADAGGAAPNTVMVGQGGHMFAPSTMTVKVGDTVHFVWAASGHNVVSGANGTADNKFCSPSDTNCGSAPLSDSGTTYDHKFTAAGDFPFFCSQHFADGMTGTITVQ